MKILKKIFYTKKSIYSIISIVIIIFGSFWYYNNISWKKNYNQGLLNIKNGNYEEAIKFFDKTINTNPNCSNAYIDKGIALNALTNYQQAIKSYDTALLIDDTNIRIFISKAKTLYLMKKYEDSIIECDIGLKLKKHSNLYNIKGASLATLGEYNEAIENYNKAIEQNPNYFDPHQNKFCPLFKLGRYKEALESINKAIELEPKNSKIDIMYTNKASALNKLGCYEEAIEACNIALALNPKNENAINAKNQALELLKCKEL